MSQSCPRCYKIVARACQSETESAECRELRNQRPLEKSNEYSVTIGERLFTAKRSGPDAAWQVDYPEGGFQRHGTKSEVANLIRAKARELAAADAEADAS
jgi:hypothetical protein